MVILYTNLKKYQKIVTELKEEFRIGNIRADTELIKIEKCYKDRNANLYKHCIKNYIL